MKKIKEMRRWFCWNARETKGRMTKVPCASDGGVTGTNEKYAHTWVTFDEATAAMRLHRCTGVGFVIPEGVFFLDKDHIAPDDPVVKNLFVQFPTYAEKSFSGNGLHIYGFCDLSRLPVKDGKLDKRYYTKNPYNGLEVYIGGLTNRFAAFTGDAIQDLTLADCTETLLTLLEEQMLRERNMESASVTTDDTIAKAVLKKSSKR